MRTRAFAPLGLVVVACHSSSPSAHDSADSSSGTSTGPGSAFEDGTASPSESTSTGPSESGTTSSDASSGSATSTGGSEEATSAASEPSGDDSDSGSSSGESGAAVDPFPPAPPFGDNVLDYDLVGSWGLNWQPESGFDSLIEIDDQGSFSWVETSADCSSSTTASGYLWVDGIQIVMHVDTWERPLPWDTEPVLGEVFEPPFRLRMSFSLQGGGGDAYLTLAAPSRVTEAAPYDGSSYVRIDQQGAYLGGSWRGEAELEAVPAGETEVVTIVRDVYEALLDPEPDGNPESTGTRAVTTTYFPVPVAFYEYEGGNWTCLGGCPVGSGLTLVDGGNLFTYGPYASYEHLLTFVDGRTFRRDVTSDCM